MSTTTVSTSSTCHLAGLPAVLQTFFCDVISEACSDYVHPHTSTIHTTVTGSSTVVTTTAPITCGTASPTTTLTVTALSTAPAQTSDFDTTLPVSTITTTATGSTVTVTITVQLPESTEIDTSTPAAVQQTDSITPSPVTTTDSTFIVTSTVTSEIDTTFTTTSTTDTTFIFTTGTVTTTVTTTTTTSTATATATTTPAGVNNCSNGSTYTGSGTYGIPYNEMCGMYCTAPNSRYDVGTSAASFTACLDICSGENAISSVGVYNIDTGSCTCYSETYSGISCSANPAYDTGYDPNLYDK